MKLKDILWVLFISMVPVIELRGAIPVGAGLGIPWYICIACAIVGNILPVPFILFFVDKVFAFMKKHKILVRFVEFCERKASKGAAKIEDSAERKNDSAHRIPWGTCIALFAFVAVPLPGTGAWTGSLIAALARIPKKYAIPTIALGVVVAGVIMTVASYGAVAALEWLL